MPEHTTVGRVYGVDACAVLPHKNIALRRFQQRIHRQPVDRQRYAAHLVGIEVYRIQAVGKSAYIQDIVYAQQTRHTVAVDAL